MYTIKRPAKTILIVLGSIIFLLVLANIIISSYIKKNLPLIINKEEKVPYNIIYDELDINLLSGSMTLYDVHIAPKDSMEGKVQSRLLANIKTIKIKHANLWSLLFNDEIKVRRVLLDTPKVILQKQDSSNINNELRESFKQTITTGSIGIINGSFTMLDKKENLLAKASGIIFEIDDIKIDSSTLNNNIPVKFSSYSFKCDSVFYKIDKFYNVTASRITNSESSLTINNLKLIPQYTRSGFTMAMPVEKDLFTVTIKQLRAPGAAWGFADDKLFVHTPEITIQNADLNVYRNKLPKDDTTVKKMYSHMLRDLNFDLKAEKVLLKNANIVYEEQVNFSRPAAKVIFTDFYATIHNLYSPVNKKKLPETVIDVQCSFMNAAPLKVNWTFNVGNNSDAFIFKGSLGKIKTDNLNQIMKPLVNFTATGTINKLHFNYNGNKEAATGKFAIDYEDLKVTIFDEEGIEKKGLMSALGNLAVKNNSKSGLKEVEIKVDRAKDKSFFNYIWLCTQDGLRKAMLPKIVEKALPDVKPPKGN